MASDAHARALFAEVRSKHPRFFEALVADARVTAQYRGERSEFRSRLDAIVQAVRLMWTSDAFFAHMLYRAKARLQQLGVPLLPRLAHHLAMATAQVSIGDPVLMHPGVYIAHGQVVIDGFAEVHSGTVLFPWVTVGLRDGVYQGPVIGPEVHVGTGAKIIGPIKIGSGARIGANAAVVADVAEGATVVGVPARAVPGRSRSQGPTACASPFGTRPAAEVLAVRLGRRSRGAGAVALDESVPRPVRAEALAASGRGLEAIELLTAANREQRDPEIERRLIELRFEALDEALGSEGPASWPPVVTDLFPGRVGPPEISPDELTPETLRSGILRHGCLLVRGFVDQGRVAQLVEDTDRAFDGHDAWAAGAPASETAPWFVPLDWYGETDRAWARQSGGILAVESPRGFFDVMETFEDAGVRDLATDYLGEPPVLLANKWTLRRVLASADDADWHQDGSFMGKEVRSLDLWVSLSHCGDDAPGLDVVARRLEGTVDTGTDVRFHPGMTRNRYAIEAWFASPSSYPEKQLPVAY